MNTPYLPYDSPIFYDTDSARNADARIAHLMGIAESIYALNNIINDLRIENEVLRKCNDHLESLNTEVFETQKVGIANVLTHLLTDKE